MRLIFKIFFAIIISDKIRIQNIKVKRTANCNKGKINNRLIQKQALSSKRDQVKIVNSK